MGGEEDKLDKAERRNTGPLMKVSAAAALPTEEPQASPVQQRASIVKKIAELEDQFRYMGTGHPRYGALKQRLEDLKSMLDRLG